MPITNVDGWSTTANSNSDVGGISIATGMSPSNIDNALREIMAQVAATPLAETAATMRTNLGLVAERQAKKAARIAAESEPQ